MASTRQALAELMAPSGIEEQGKAFTLIIHHLMPWYRVVHCLCSRRRATRSRSLRLWRRK
jgi:hypothetical protein